MKATISPRPKETSDRNSRRAGRGVALIPPRYGMSAVASLQLLEGASADPKSRGNDARLPVGLKSGIEALSGIPMDAVIVHYNSSEPAQVTARAYAQGSHIYVAPGQERHLPHEAWHVVQQAQGRVQPTRRRNGGAVINDDQSLENEADVMGACALATSLPVVDKTAARPGPAAAKNSRSARQPEIGSGNLVGDAEAGSNDRAQESFAPSAGARGVAAGRASGAGDAARLSSFQLVADDCESMVGQRRTASLIASSPRQVAQRQYAEALYGGRQMATQHRAMDSMQAGSGVVQGEFWDEAKVGLELTFQNGGTKAYLGTAAGQKKFASLRKDGLPNWWSGLTERWKKKLLDDKANKMPESAVLKTETKRTENKRT